MAELVILTSGTFDTEAEERAAFEANVAVCQAAGWPAGASDSYVFGGDVPRSHPAFFGD